MIRLNEHGNGLAASQQGYLADAKALSGMEGRLAGKGAELVADMTMAALRLITQGHAKPMYRSAENPRAAGRQKTG